MLTLSKTITTNIFTTLTQTLPTGKALQWHRGGIACSGIAASSHAVASRWHRMQWHRGGIACSGIAVASHAVASRWHRMQWHRGGIACSGIAVASHAVASHAVASRWHGVWWHGRDVYPSRVLHVCNDELIIIPTMGVHVRDIPP